jgi:hypothetical protein
MSPFGYLENGASTEQAPKELPFMPGERGWPEAVPWGIDQIGISQKSPGQSSGAAGKQY